MFGSLGLPELLVIFLIVLVLFGANKLPQLGKGLGSAIRNFKEGVNEGKDGTHQS
jgi:sec-independent protein translocase protein TatA